MAVYAIGDVQGCFTELKQLLKKIRFNPNEDYLWLVGDLVNRGPDSLQVTFLALPRFLQMGRPSISFLLRGPGIL